MSEGGDPGKRARLLPAYVEIMVAAGDLEAAELGCAELDSIAQAEEKPGALAAMAAQARGLVELAADARRSHLPSCAGPTSSGADWRRRTRAAEPES